ncbi:hypothetical protein [Stackebrandtia nassauensis]|uniref:Uncharacterized protein n=1 Tax=Stackebrandtia nassauensis (strain DSM 44728 / CIP 108903 / NRRL B-16338 / NBRC 102104 / LLR-40K-21) TaxID=446470 RepID=D3PWD7_STANL|nr:hypothetical protein [Stackebrandtia nassauensis]ADD41294.1 hypothetical protein Snas_1591 [Stackebrandtia nassauensis DSM 44728]
MSEYRTVLGERVALARARVRGWLRRVTALGLTLRATILVSGVAAILASAPDPRLGLSLAVVLPVVAMARPFGAWVWAVELAAVFGWIVGNLTVDDPSLVLAFGIGAAVYVHHAAATLATVTRVDAAVEAAVVRGWALRQAVVLAAAAIAAAMTIILSGQPMPVPPQALVVIGVLGALGIPVAVVASLSRR